MGKLAFAVLYSCLVAASATAMEFAPHTTESGVPVVFASGEIVEGDTRKLELLLDQGKVESRIIVLDSPGGDLVEAMSLGQSLRYFGFTTFLHPRAQCLSACAYAFFGGEYRVALPGAALGVHQFSGGPDDVRGQSGTQAISGAVIGYLNDMGISAKVAEKAMITAPDQMHIFDGEEFAALGLLREPDDRSFARREAESLGIAEAEWMLRRSFYLQSSELHKCYENQDDIQRSYCLFAVRAAHGIRR